MVKINIKELFDRPFIIAEMSGNHNQSLERAFKIVEAAASSGVSALKIQTYTADTMTIDSDLPEFTIKDKNSLWNGKKLYSLYEEASTPWEWHKPIFDKCNDLGIIGFSTPFDETAVDFLESLDVPLYKIASFEMVDIPLIKRVAQTRKPVIISTGMGSEEEINEAVDVARVNGCPEVVLLKCTSAYPALPENANILTIPDMKQRFKCRVGISDHTLGIGVSVASVALGADVIEKHFTLSRADGGVDSAFSMEPDEMKMLVNEAKRAWQALGQVNYLLSEKEKGSLMFRRSLYVIKDIKKGDTITKDNVKSIRPGYGLPSNNYEGILGKRVSCDVIKGQPLSWEIISKE